MQLEFQASAQDLSSARRHDWGAYGRCRGLLLGGCAGILLCANSVEARVVERIAAVVGKEIILLSEVQDRIAPAEAQLRSITDRALRRQRRAQLRKQVLTQMINDKLIAQEARKLKLEVQDSELDKAVTEVMRRNNLTQEQLVAALRQEGKTLEAYKHEMLKPQLLRMKVLNIQVRSRLSVTDDEIKALYQKNLRSLGVETKVRARHIFVALLGNPNADQVGQRLAVANELLNRIKQGEDFAKLAREHSDDSVTRDEGGDLGYFARGTLPASVEDAVFSAKKGDILGPLRSSRGFHLIEITDRQESSARPLKEVKDELRNRIYAQKMEKATKTWLAEVRQRSYVDIRL